MKRRFWMDNEFIEDGESIYLISTGWVCEDGREYYAEVVDDEIPWDKASPWVLENVKPHLVGGTAVRTKAEIADELIEFVEATVQEPQIWGYYCDYDWVVVCWLFGTMIELPEGWPMFCMDVKQLAEEMGNPRLPDQEGTEHHALEDARGVKARHHWLLNSVGAGQP